ncbi:MAG: hypothetical protein Q7R95_10100 [bacterium]|nr:hypothetical protein [bacterium]
MEPTQTPTQEPVQNSPAVPTPQTKLNYWIMIFFSILGIVFLILIIFLYQQNQQLKKQAVSIQVVPTAQVLLPTLQSASPTTHPVSSISIPPDETAGWKTYINRKYNYQLKYPSDFEIVKGPVPESELPMLDNISFDGKQKPEDSNSGVVFGINADPTDFNGVALLCVDNDSCLNAWMKVLGKTSNQVSFVSVNILGGDQKGFEYINQNSLYTQQNKYFIFSHKGKPWIISMTNNNFSNAETQEINSLFDQILSTFKFID